jgi:hypothetical protein
MAGPRCADSGQVRVAGVGVQEPLWHAARLVVEESSGLGVLEAKHHFKRVHAGSDDAGPVAVGGGLPESRSTPCPTDRLADGGALAVHHGEEGVAFVDVEEGVESGPAA